MRLNSPWQRRPQAWWAEQGRRAHRGCPHPKPFNNWETVTVWLKSSSVLNSFVHLSLFPVSEEPGTPPTPARLSPHLVQAHHPWTRSKSKSNNPSPSQFHLLLHPLLLKRPVLFSPSLLFKHRKSLTSPFDQHACNLFSYVIVETRFASFCPPFWGTRIILKKENHSLF